MDVKSRVVLLICAISCCCALCGCQTTMKHAWEDSWDRIERADAWMREHMW